MITTKLSTIERGFIEEALDQYIIRLAKADFGKSLEVAREARVHLFQLLAEVDGVAP